MKALIDGDIALYAVGFAADKDGYEFEEACKEFDAFIDKVVRRSGADEFIICLSGSKNFRDEIAVTRKYKGNRDDKHKPTHFYELKNRLLGDGGGVYTFDQINLSNNEEADDVMGRLQVAGNGGTIICTIDKDLDQIPGWHYNWRKEIIYYVEHDDAVRFFYQQLLSGDPVDNIIGVPGCGPVGARKLVAAEHLGNLEELVRREYQKAYPDNWEQVLEEHKQLIGIRWF